MARGKDVDKELLPSGRHDDIESWTDWTLARMVPFIIGIVFGVMLLFVANKESIMEGTALTSCRYALGGGAVLQGGNFPQEQINSGSCASQFRQYLEQQYDKDVETAIESARQYFYMYPMKPNASKVIVLDIDETSLSNRAEYLSMLRTGKRGLLSSVETFAGSRGRNADAPALKPMLDLYLDLYKEGFSVTFITGRTDKGDVRENTAKNLESVGYGVGCSDARSRVEGQDDEPCYVELAMRKPEDSDLLASVYKPMQRKSLQERGYEIIASFGDQFSDLEGTSSAVASFKLPNPFYYIL